MPDSEAIGDYRDVLPFWQARSTWAALIGTAALILGLAGVQIDAAMWSDKAFELVSTAAYLWAYMERIGGTKRLVFWK